MSANDKQISGNHYKQFKNYEPWDVVNAWGLGYLDGTALKYIARWKHKNGIEDLRKALHFLEKLIETELASPSVGAVEQRANLSGVAYKESFDDAVGRFRNALDVATPHWNPNLNTEAILRPDNV